jgi:hypothetical protein
MWRIFTTIRKIFSKHQQTKYIKTQACIFFIFISFLITNTATAGALNLLQALFTQNAITFSQMIYQVWSEGSTNSVKAIEFTVAHANDIAITLSYANVQDKTKKYKLALFKLLYAEDDLASATMKKNTAMKNLKKSLNIESPEFASNKMSQEKYKSTLFLYDKALKNRDIELNAFERAKARYDAAIDNFVKIRPTTKQNT